MQVIYVRRTLAKYYSPISTVDVFPVSCSVFCLCLNMKQKNIRKMKLMPNSETKKKCCLRSENESGAGSRSAK